MSTDRIEKTILLRASRTRVWRALSDAHEFGAWFGVKFEGEFAPRAKLAGRILTPPGYEHLKFEIEIERVVPEMLLSYRWHPYAIDPAVDYSQEPTTLVEFHLADEEGGTRVTVVESGFDGIPIARRAEASRVNDSGWAHQLKNLERHAAA